MKKGFTLIELLVVVAIVVILGFLAFGILGGGCNSISTAYGRNLRMESRENSGWQTKWHWTDVSTGERFYSLDAEGTTLYRE